MRLKSSLRTPEEEKFLLRNHNLNQKYGEKLADFSRTESTKITATDAVRYHQGWPTFHEPRKTSTTRINENVPRAYSPTLASPMEDGSDQAMSLSSPEDRNANTEDDSSSDLDCNETSPLLADLDESCCDDDEEEEEEEEAEDRECDSISDDCNNNNNHHHHNNSSSGAEAEEDSEDSMFSDSSDMSEPKEECLLLENFNNNNNNNINVFENRTRNQLYIGREKGVRSTNTTRGKKKTPTLTASINAESHTFKPSSESCDGVITIPTKKTETDPGVLSGAITTPQLQAKVVLPDVLPVDANQPQTDCGATGCILGDEVSPMSDSSSSSDLDVNMVTHSFNNFSLSAGKHNDIQHLVEAKDKDKDINIREVQLGCFPEPKILNTGESLPRNMTIEYQHHLRNKDSPWHSTRSLEESLWKRDSRIADGLVLEKVNTDHNWKLKQGAMCRSDDILKHFGVSQMNGIRSSGSSVQIDIPKSKSTFSGLEDLLKLINEDPVPPCDSAKEHQDERNDVEETADEEEVSKEEQSSPTKVECIKPLSDLDSRGEPRRPPQQDIESPIDNNLTLVDAGSVRSEMCFSKNDENCNNDDGNNNDNQKNNNHNNAINNEVAVAAASTAAPAKATTTTTTTTSTRSVLRKEGKTTSPAELLGDFDVYNIETTMPTIDWVAMEAHLTRAAKEDDWLIRRRNDREEIRRKLAMDSDTEEYYCGERVTRKPSLSTRLQSGMNLQICFMNETASDQESQGSDHDTEGGISGDSVSIASPPGDESPAHQRTGKGDSTAPGLQDSLKGCSSPNNNSIPATNNNGSSDGLSSNNNSSPTKSTVITNGSKRQRPSFFFARQRSWRLRPQNKHEQRQPTDSQEKQPEPEDFYTRHARLQAEARMALAQAKEMARMQMEVERQRSKKSPIADIVGLPFPDGRHRLSRQVLTDMNVAQLQVIVNDLHTQIENLNEDLVRFLLDRDDLHMEQDSMLVDIEDLTRYLGAKDEAQRGQQLARKPKSSCKK